MFCFLDFCFLSLCPVSLDSVKISSISYIQYLDFQKRCPLFQCFKVLYDFLIDPSEMHVCIACTVSAKKTPTFTCLSNMFLHWRNFSIGLHINWFNCFVLVGDDYKGTNNFNDSNHLCEDYKKESGSRCTY